MQTELQTGQKLIAQALVGVVGEVRLADYLGEQVQGRVELVGGGQAAHAHQCHIPVGAVFELGPQILEAGSNFTRVQPGCAFIQHAIDQCGQAG